jgi:hypothetical protein
MQTPPRRKCSLPGAEPAGPLSNSAARCAWGPNPTCVRLAIERLLAEDEVELFAG